MAWSGLSREYWEGVVKRTGTTTLGIRCVDGVVLATDRRVTSGYFVAHKRGKKIYVIDERAAVTVAGAVADAQKVVDSLKAEAMLYRLETGRYMKIKMLATLASTILFQVRPFVLIVQMLIGGLDDGKPALCSVDWLGSVTEEKYITTGSGSHMALAVLETEYRDDLTVEEAIPIAVKAVRAAMSIDPGSGEGVDVVVIDKNGVREIPEDEIKKIV